MGKIQILELFGGIGSPRCALRNIGVPVKAIDYVEIDEKAVRSYNAMFEDELAYKDIRWVHWNERQEIQEPFTSNSKMGTWWMDEKKQEQSC